MTFAETTGRAIARSISAGPRIRGALSDPAQEKGALEDEPIVLPATRLRRGGDGLEFDPKTLGKVSRGTRRDDPGLSAALERDEPHALVQGGEVKARPTPLAQKVGGVKAADPRMAVERIHAPPSVGGKSSENVGEPCVGIDVVQLACLDQRIERRCSLAALSILSIAMILALFRPLLLSSVSTDLGEARGVSSRLMELLFLAVVALATATALPVVGALMVFSLMVGPASAARALTDRPMVAMLLSAVAAVVMVWASIALSYTLDWPIGFFVGALSALAYAAGRVRMWSAAYGRQAAPRELRTPG